MSWRSDEIDKEEARFYAQRENACDRAYFEREMYEIARSERCAVCEMNEDGECSIGEDYLKCSVWN